jgi:hypothetical protein
LWSSISGKRLNASKAQQELEKWTRQKNPSKSSSSSSSSKTTPPLIVLMVDELDYLVTPKKEVCVV